MPEASTLAGQSDALFFTLVALTVFFTVGVSLALIVFALRYRRGARVDRSRPVNEHHLLEMTWSIIPLIMGLGIFVWGSVLFAQFRQPPANAEEIFLIGKRWMWHFQHLNGIREMNELHIPTGRPFKLTMISQDVIHDMFVPAFRVHQDVIPGHYTEEWFEATETGKYHFFCSQFCGTNHSTMTGYVYVMTPSDYEEWLRRGGPQGETVTPGSKQTPLQEGADLWDQKACGTCHGPTDSPRAPSLVGLFGRTVHLANGRTLTADVQYVRDAILNPENYPVTGYPQTMPSYKELTEEQILDLVAYIRSLGATGGKTPQTASAGTSPSGTTGTQTAVLGGR